MGVMSGERGGQRIGPRLPIHLFGNVSLRATNGTDVEVF